MSGDANQVGTEIETLFQLGLFYYTTSTYTKCKQLHVLNLLCNLGENTRPLQWSFGKVVNKQLVHT